MPKTILIVDDDKDLLEVLIMVFEQEDFVVHVAISGMGALEVLDRVAIEVVLLDIRMPYMDGYELLRYIRQVPGLKKIPVLLNSAGTDAQITKTGDPFVSTMMKPFGLEEIVGAVEELRLDGRSHDYEGMVMSEMYTT